MIVSQVYLPIVAFAFSVLMDASDGAIRIPDPGLRTAIEAELGTSSPSASDMLRLTTLNAPNRSIKVLVGLEHADNIESLNLDHNEIEDASLLSQLSQLRFVSLRNNRLRRFPRLARLPELQILRLEDNPLDPDAEKDIHDTNAQVILYGNAHRKLSQMCIEK